MGLARSWSSAGESTCNEKLGLRTCIGFGRDKSLRLPCYCPIGELSEASFL